MNHLKKLGLSIILFGFIFSGCSSGGGGGGNPATTTPTTTPQASTKISGSVSGTTIIAVNDAGDIVATADTDGVTADAQGNFDFVLENIPVGNNVRVFLITAAGIYPMYFDSDGDGTPDTNVFNPGSETEISLGFVNTEISGQTGRAIPENNPTDIAGVTTSVAITAIPESLFNPNTENETLAALLDKGLAAIKNEWFAGARTYLKKAVEVAGTDTSNEADTARFFHAVLRMSVLPGDTLSDGNAEDFNSFGDYLDKLGCDTSDTRRANLDAWENMCPEDDEPSPSDSPTGANYQTLLADLLGQETEGAIANLDAISTSFNFKTVFEGENVEFDHSDVLILRAGLKGLLALISIQDAYDMNVDLDFEASQESNPENTAEDVLDRYPTILGLKDAEKLAKAKLLLIGGANDTLAAIASIENESDPQEDDLVDFLGDEDDTPASVAAEIAQFKEDLQRALNCLNDTEDCVDDQNDLDPNDDLVFTLQPLFTGAVDFNQLLPSFTGNVPGAFSDGTMAGTFLDGSLDINEDINPANGVPDLIDRLNGGSASAPAPS